MDFAPLMATSACIQSDEKASFTIRCFVSPGLAIASS